jgi:hypothetical protein
MNLMLLHRRPAPVIEEEMLMAPESETAAPELLAMSATEPVVSEPEAQSGILARVRGWFAQPWARAA